MIQYSVNHGLTGGTLMARVPDTIPDAKIFQWTQLWQHAGQLVHDGYTADATRLLDILIEWNRTSEWPTAEDLEFLS